jgi:hypothetical protein
MKTMSTSKRQKLRIPEPRSKSGGRYKIVTTIAVVLLAGTVAAVTLLRGAGGEFDALNGRWRRPDGGYVLEIRSVDAGGKIDASYLNPKAINIAKAEATREASTLKVFVELRAPNYPGSTYTLTYDQEQDQLKGIYFQAVEQQRFNVNFVRIK